MKRHFASLIFLRNRKFPSCYLVGVVLIYLITITITLFGRAAAATNVSSGYAAGGVDYLDIRAKLKNEIFGLGHGKLPTKALPDEILYHKNLVPSDGNHRIGVYELRWDISRGTSPWILTVWYIPKSGNYRQPSPYGAWIVHHGHSYCKGCDKCGPTCRNANEAANYKWWDLYNMTSTVHQLEQDILVVSMPLHGVNTKQMAGTWRARGHRGHSIMKNLGGGQYGLKSQMQPFLEGSVLAINFAEKQLGTLMLARDNNSTVIINSTGNEAASHRSHVGAAPMILMTGLSGGGWTTHWMAAIDERISISFPTAGHHMLRWGVTFSNNNKWGIH